MSKLLTLMYTSFLESQIINQKNHNNHTIFVACIIVALCFNLHLLTLHSYRQKLAINPDIDFVL